ncbi:MAG: hypothetical protein Ct9H300mP16_07970 [Pseudomonadota bacterium]|nr:MAG: hypothetical protein Ct9H300mP16_07970 [Pseudomonadota bacterium]
MQSVGIPAGNRAFLGLTRDDRRVAAAPCYLKSHSYGEFIFDWAWARAYQQPGALSTTRSCWWRFRLRPSPGAVC